MAVIDINDRGSTPNPTPTCPARPDDIAYLIYTSAPPASQRSRRQPPQRHSASHRG
ncbi:hypothetical protein I553_2300 [Mycobacterium xenopi 4042]|uniref:Uncharacterized protein n=1 Tax=Mycobacterium xenopi 4042 TaxID=1299334 RepID=X7ZET7_MYCXE|nr:hypothetical protein I553_2300 [Mycobacterium xenopi 4042]